MATVRRFEELDVWQLARAFCKEVDGWISKPVFDDWPRLRQQMDGSSGSVMDNIAEGFDRFSRAQFRQFLVIARGSAAEARSQLYRAIDKQCIGQQEGDVLLAAARNLSVKISNLITYLDQSGFKEKPRQAPATVPSGQAQED